MKKYNVFWISLKSFSNPLNPIIRTAIGFSGVEKLSLISSAIAIDEPLPVPPANEVTIIICPINIAIKNTQILMNKSKIDCNASRIGLYRRLGDSCYFFRIDTY